MAKKKNKISNNNSEKMATKGSADKTIEERALQEAMEILKKDMATNEPDFIDLDETIQRIIYNADSYLNSTMFSAESLEDAFEDSLRDIDQRIELASNIVSTMEPPPAPPLTPSQPALSVTVDNPSRQPLRRRAASEASAFVTRSSPATNEPASDDDIVFVSSTILRPRFIETVDLCSPEEFRYNRRLEGLVIDENVITLDDTPIFEPDVNVVGQHICVATSQPTEPTGLTAAKRSKPVDLNDSEPSGLTCPVCLEGLKNRQPQSTICGHLYCKSCIMEVMRTTHKCAICKRKLRKGNVHPIYL